MVLGMDRPISQTIYTYTYTVIVLHKFTANKRVFCMLLWDSFEVVYKPLSLLFAATSEAKYNCVAQ